LFESCVDLLKFHIKTGDTEGLVNYPQSIQGIKLVALVIDRDEERKWSFRSQADGIQENPRQAAPVSNIHPKHETSKAGTMIHCLWPPKTLATTGADCSRSPTH
jgi:hypothetical protein